MSTAESGHHVCFQLLIAATVSALRRWIGSRSDGGGDVELAGGTAAAGEGQQGAAGKQRAGWVRWGCGEAAVMDQGGDEDGEQHTKAK